MKAIVLKGFGGVEVLHPAEIAVPEIGADEVLVQTRSISINPVDIKTRSGKALSQRLKDFDPIILGWDIAGIVSAVGSNVTEFSKGDEVFGMVNFPGHGKAYAEYVAAPASHLALKPKNIGFQQAAVSTLAALTAWEGLVDHLKIKKGDRLLVHAAAGGVGHFVVQLAKHLGAYVIGTASAKNKSFVLGLGADEFVDYTLGPLEQSIGSIDKVFDNMGGENIDASFKVMKPGASILSIPSGKNDGVEEKAAAAGFSGYKMLVSSNGQNQAKIGSLLEAGYIRPHISNRYSLEQMAEAHLQIETGRTVGKLAIDI
ncbi:NADP-dependent oxidoreductase [Pollutibacter soli]|uniref:NADP-dependent oxidoreductase n=1 Tax=Pollutibacter soli TaxID=3034157 RepID=UPI0030137FD6